MYSTVNYCVARRKQRLFLKPTRNWDEKDNTFEFVIQCWLDSTNAKSPENWSTRVFLGEYPIMVKNNKTMYVCQ